jgi:hypothetical protein
VVCFRGPQSADSIYAAFSALSAQQQLSASVGKSQSDG